MALQDSVKFRSPRKIILKAHFIKETDKAWYLDFEGDKRWVPKSTVKFEKLKSEVEIPSWLANDLFPNENL